MARLTSVASVNDTGGAGLKVDIISDAYSQLRISGLTRDPTPEDLEVALMRLENMAAEWNSRNITTNYNFEDTPDPNSELGLKRGYWNAYATNLAVRLIPDFGKEVPITLYNQARQSLSSLSGRVALENLNQVSYPRRMARGSGNTLRYNRWARFYRDGSAFVNTTNAISMYIGDINDYTEHFDNYLSDDSNEVIESFEIILDDGLELVSSSNDSPDINYRIKAVSNSNLRSNERYSQQVTIVVTTDLGRVETRRKFFELVPATTRSN